MKKTIPVWMLIILATAMVACLDESQELIYSSNDNIYFNFDDEFTTDRDSIFFTFAYTPEKTVDTVFLPIMISGIKMGYDREFKVGIREEGTTAEEGLNYAPLQDFYTMPADSGTIDIPLILYSADPVLADTSLVINLVLEPTEHFGIGFPELVTAKVVFSKRLEKPAWWDLWQGQLSNYSRVKHQFYLIVVGNKDLISSYQGDNFMFIPSNLFYIDQLRRFLSDPFAWAVDNPGSGYVLEKQSDGLYHFFNPENPDNTFQLKLNPDDNRYYFQDEHGARVTVN